LQPFLVGFLRIASLYFIFYFLFIFIYFLFFWEKNEFWGITQNWVMTICIIFFQKKSVKKKEEKLQKNKDKNKINCINRSSIE
jgi:hypothetical protein